MKTYQQLIDQVKAGNKAAVALIRDAECEEWLDILLLKAIQVGEDSRPINEEWWAQQNEDDDYIRRQAE